jgi:GT2 family glycosyltransferase
MMNYARRPDVGAVGAQLLYGDGTIQHAGVILGYGGLAGHAFEGMRPEEAPRMVSCARTYSAVTAACMVVRRSLFEKLGGFEAALGVAYNDIDLCLRIGAAGYQIVYTPYAKLFHYESRTRGLELTDEKAERIRRESAFFQKRWAELLQAGDPHYSPNLTLEKADFSLRR